MIIEVWANRIEASSPDEAAMKIREACGCAEGKLVIREVWPGEWYEYRCEYRRGESGGD